MNKKFTSAMDEYELDKVFDSNTRLRNEISVSSINDMKDKMGDWIDCFRGSIFADYDYNAYTVITVYNDDKFIRGFQRLQSEFGELTDNKYYDMIKEYLNKTFILGESCEDKNIKVFGFYDRLNNIVRILKQDLEKEIDDMFLYCTTYEGLKEFYWDNYVENAMDDENRYIIIDDNGNSDYILYEDIQKSYK